MQTQLLSLSSCRHELGSRWACPNAFRLLIRVAAMAKWKPQQMKASTSVPT